MKGIGTSDFKMLITKEAMKSNSAIAFAEVDEILNLMEDKYVQRIPQKLRDLFKSQKAQNYSYKVDINKPLDEQNLQRKTMVLLATLNLNYWCEDEEEKQEILRQLAYNEEASRKALAEKHSVDNIFKNRMQKKEIENVQIVEYKEKNFIRKIWSRIKSLLKKK